MQYTMKVNLKMRNVCSYCENTVVFVYNDNYNYKIQMTFFIFISKINLNGDPIWTRSLLVCYLMWS